MPGAGKQAQPHRTGATLHPPSAWGQCGVVSPSNTPSASISPLPQAGRGICPPGAPQLIKSLTTTPTVGLGPTIGEMLLYDLKSRSSKVFRHLILIGVKYLNTFEDLGLNLFMDQFPAS